MTTFNIEPFTHTGAIATYSMSDETELYGGWTPGWGTGFDHLHRGNCFLGGFSTSQWDNIALAYTSTAGEPGWRGNGYSHSIVLDFTVTDKLSYVPQTIWFVPMIMTATRQHSAGTMILASTST